MKVEITQAQAEFIESFKEKDELFNDEKVEIGENFPLWASNAIYNISRFGYGYPMTNGRDEEVSGISFNPEHYKEFTQDSKALLIKAVIDGYKIKKVSFVLYLDFTDSTNGREKRRLYYGLNHHVTDKTNATVFPGFEISEEELMAQGWKKEVL